MTSLFDRMSPEMRAVAADRDAKIQDIVCWFKHSHLDPTLQRIARRYEDMAIDLLDDLPDSYQLVDALKRLVESKDYAVRAAIVALDEMPGPNNSSPFKHDREAKELS